MNLVLILFGLGLLFLVLSNLLFILFSHEVLKSGEREIQKLKNFGINSFRFGVFLFFAGLLIWVNEKYSIFLTLLLLAVFFSLIMFLFFFRVKQLEKDLRVKSLKLMKEIEEDLDRIYGENVSLKVLRQIDEVRHLLSKGKRKIFTKEIDEKDMKFLTKGLKEFRKFLREVFGE